MCGLLTGTVFSSTADSVLGNVANPLPSNGRFAKVIHSNFAGIATSLGSPTSNNVFVTASDDLLGLNANQISQRLTLVDQSGNYIPGPFTIFEFDTPANIASPFNRNNPGFLPGGRTAGGAREFVLPNYNLNQLNNLIIREVR